MSQSPPPRALIDGVVWHLDVGFVHRYAIESQIVGFLLILGLEKVPRVAHFVRLIS